MKEEERDQKDLRKFLDFVYEGPKKPEEVREERRGLDLAGKLWLSAIILYGVGDTLTSFLAFEVGGVEANPLFKKVLELGGGIPAFVMLKAASLIALYFISKRFVKRRWVIPSLLMGVGLILVVHNLLMLHSFLILH